MSGRLDCQLVIEMIGGTLDSQIAQYASQPDGPLKGLADIYIYIYIYVYAKVSVRVPGTWKHPELLSPRCSELLHSPQIPLYIYREREIRKYT